MGDSSNKSENIWKKGVAHVIDLLSSLFLPFINLMVSVGILKGILVLMVVGAMGAQNVMVHLSAVINVGATEVVLQNVLDGLVLNLLPFGLIMGTWQLLKKKVSPIVVVLLLMAIGIIGYYLNILGLGA